MKIFQINSVCGIRSTGRIVADIYAELKTAGHDCKIAYGRLDAKNVAENDVYKIGSKRGVYFDGLMTRLSGRAGAYSRKATKKLIDYIKNYGPDIIHLHNIHGYYINIFLLFDFLKTFHGKVVWTLHDCWPFTGHCAYFERSGCEKWKTHCKECPSVKEYPKSLFFDCSSKQYAEKKAAFCGLKDLTLITPSNWLNNLVKQSFLNEYNVITINNGINTADFRHVESADYRYKLPGKKILLGVAVPFTERKGFSDFIKLSRMLNDDYVLVLVGLDERQKSSLPANIVGLPRTNKTDVLAELYSRAECFLNLTYEDNFPTTNIESLCCGTPVITYDTGGSAEVIIKSGGYGAIIPKGDLNGVCCAISKLQDKKEEIENISRQARSLFDRKIMVEKYLNLYETICENIK